VYPTAEHYMLTVQHTSGPVESPVVTEQDETVFKVSLVNCLFVLFVKFEYWCCFPHPSLPPLERLFSVHAPRTSLSEPGHISSH